jgi:hypothetical protein
MFIAFDEERCTVDTGRYNGLLETWIERREIDEYTAERFWFPARENPRVLLSSPDTDLLCEASGKCFNQMPFAEVDHAYCGSNDALQEFYRITPFVPREDCKSKEEGLSNNGVQIT